MYIVKYSDRPTRRSFQRRPSYVEIEQADVVIEVNVVKGAEDNLDPRLQEVIELLREITGD